MEARLPRAAEPQRAHQEATTTGSTCGPGSRTSTPSAASTPSTRPTCAAGCAGGASTPSASPGSTAAAPRTLEPEELDDRYFMLRVRIDGGALTTEQLRLVGEISRDHARDTADVTDRQNIQYHWIEIEDMPAIWQKLEANGLLTTEACGDTPRVILGSPVAGDRRRREDRPAAGHRRDPRPLHRQPGVLQPAAQVQDRDLLAAGRRARGQRRVVHRGRAPRARPRLRRVGRRRAVHQPEDRPAARRLGAAGRGPRRVGRASCRSSATTATARLRHRARIKFLVADWGAAEFRRVLEEEYLHRALIDGPAPEIPAAPDRPRRGAQAARRAQLRRRRARRPGGCPGPR